MKKDIEWLKREKANVLQKKLQEGFNFSLLNGINNDLNELIGQLNESNVSIETVHELLEANRKLAARVKELEPELPVIPQFVADQIQTAKEDNLNIYGLISRVGGMELDGWEVSENLDVVARAWLDGYTIEKEKLYYMKLNNNVSDQLLLGNRKYLNILIGESGQPYIFDNKPCYSKAFKTMLNKDEVEIWKNKLAALDFEIEDVPNV